MAKNFGVAESIVNDINIPVADAEDLAVGSGSLLSGRDRSLTESSVPSNVNQWFVVAPRPTSTRPPMTPAMSPRIGAMDEGTKYYIPKNRMMVNRIVDSYFTHLNPNRPVFTRAEFQMGLDSIYDGCNVAEDGENNKSLSKK